MQLGEYTSKKANKSESTHDKYKLENKIGNYKSGNTNRKVQVGKYTLGVSNRKLHIGEYKSENTHREIQIDTNTNRQIQVE